MVPDVLVVGAGPAGSAVSILLAQRGYRVVLVDRATFPRDKPCAEYLSPACTPILHRLGVLEAVLAARPRSLWGMRVANYRGRSCLGRFQIHGRPLPGLALPRLRLDALLVEQAGQRGVEVRCGFRVQRPLMQENRVCGVQGRTRTGQETLRAPLVIAADGLHTTLGRRLRVVHQVPWPRHVAVVTHYSAVQALQSWGEMFLVPSGYIGLAPVGDDLVNVSLVIRARYLKASGRKPAELLDTALRRHPELRWRFARARQVKAPLVVGPLAQRTVAPQHHGILFVGDAAGFFDPFTGQGIFLALHSAELAAALADRALQRGDVSAHHLRAYFSAYQRVYRAKGRLSALIQLGLSLPWLANRVIERLAHRPALADTLVSVTGDFLPPHQVLSWRFAMRMLQ